MFSEIILKQNKNFLMEEVPEVTWVGSTHLHNMPSGQAYVHHCL